MLTLNQVEKGFGGRILFSGVNLQINARDCVGLVGPNGAGKTTLFSLILGEDTPDSGTITMEKRCRLGYLPQESTPTGDETVLQVATSVRPEFTRLRAILSAHEHAGTTDSEEYAEAQAEFDDIGGYHLEPKAKRILRGLAFRESEFDRPMRELSGGWVMRAHLARLLVMEPDLLMLDEPTNHLDLHSLQWFQNYLKGYNGAILMISHDREFLNALTDSIIHIFHGKLHRYRGNYESFLQQKAQREEQAWAAYRAQQTEIAKIEEFIARFRAKATKAAQVQSRIKQLDKLERLQPPSPPEATVKLRFPQPRATGQKVINLTNIHQSYGKTKVYEGMEFAAERGDRVVLVGPNGSGKSTLLKILAGELEFQRGERKLGLNVDVAYFAQYRSLMLDGTRSVLEEALSTAGRQASEQDTRTLLGCFLFRGDDVHKSVGVLSGGEKGRLALVKILLNPPNLLLMDEPTTHLDMPSIDALTQALKQFQGTLVFISHDVYFIRGIAEKVLHIDGGKLTWYAGDYDYYLEKSGADSERAALTAGQPVYAGASEPKVKANSTGEGPIRKTKEQKRQEAEERQRRAQERRDLESALARAESRVFELERRRAEIAQKLDDPGLYQRDPAAVVSLNRELALVGDEVDKATSAWEDLAAKMQALAGTGT
jgi:ATP-binding cassette subfamily F protein 3